MPPRCRLPGAVALPPWSSSTSSRHHFT
jgi:hypothetical protein